MAPTAKKYIITANFVGGDRPLYLREISGIGLHWIFDRSEAKQFTARESAKMVSEDKRLHRELEAKP